MNGLRRLPLFVAVSLVFLVGGSAYADVVLVPDDLTLNTGTPSGDMVITYTGGGLTNVAGYSIEISWNSTLATAVFARPDNGPYSGAVAFFVVPIAPGHVRLDGVIGGADPGISSGELAKVTFTTLPSVAGSAPVDLTIVHLRDPLNGEVDGGVAVDGNLTVEDTGAPTVNDVLITNDTLGHTDDFAKDTDALTVTANVADDDIGFGAANIEADLTGLGGGAAVPPDTYVAPVATWTVASAACTPADGTVTVTVTATDASTNTANGSDDITADNTAPTPLSGLMVLPGHEQLHLSWTDITGNDANPLGVEFRYAVWGDYPVYDTAAPSYPVDHLDATLAVQVTSGAAADWPVVGRDIYYLAGFVYDMVLQYGPAGAGNQGRATNYWLGDVDGPSGVDGIVDVAYDITRLGNTYGLLDTDGGYDVLCDVGPTDTGSPRGVPLPNNDHEIAFEDMMVFALNYSVVTPSTKTSPGGTPVLAWERAGEKTWALSLLERGGDLQGLNLRAQLPGGIDGTVAAGSILADQSAPVFLRNIPRNGIDAGLALFGQGAGFSGTGELIRVTLSEPVEDLEVVVTARSADNMDLGVELGTVDPSTVPNRASLGQNYPNPFNPRTTLTFELPQERFVNLTIFAVDGTRVRTLVDGVRVAGRHEVTWDGRDEAGRDVATGTYFARVVADDFNQIRKMVLLR